MKNLSKIYVHYRSNCYCTKKSLTIKGGTHVCFILIHYMIHLEQCTTIYNLISLLVKVKFSSVSIFVMLNTCDVTQSPIKWYFNKKSQKLSIHTLVLVVFRSMTVDWSNFLWNWTSYRVICPFLWCLTGGSQVRHTTSGVWKW